MGMRHILPLLLVFGMVFSACVPLDYYDKAEVSSISIKLVGTNPDNSTNYNVSLFATINGHDVPVKDAVIFIQPFNTTGFRKEYLCRTITDGSGTATFSASKAMMNKTTFVAVFCYSNASLTCAIDDCLVVFDDNGNIGYKPSYPRPPAPPPNGIGMTSYTGIDACKDAAGNPVSGNWGQTAKVFNLTGTGNWDPANLFLSSSMVLTRASGTRVLSTDQLSICLPISILVGLLIASMFYMGVNPFFWFSMDRAQRNYIKPNTQAIQSSVGAAMSQHESVLGSVVSKTASVYGAAKSVNEGLAGDKGGIRKAAVKGEAEKAKGGKPTGSQKFAIGFVKVANALGSATGWVTGKKIAEQGGKMLGIEAAVQKSQVKVPVLTKTGAQKIDKKGNPVTVQVTDFKKFGQEMKAGWAKSGAGLSILKGLGGISLGAIGASLSLVLKTFGINAMDVKSISKEEIKKEINRQDKAAMDKTIKDNIKKKLLSNLKNRPGFSLEYFNKNYDAAIAKYFVLEAQIKEKEGVIARLRENNPSNKDIKKLEKENEKLIKERDSVMPGFVLKCFPATDKKVAENKQGMTKLWDDISSLKSRIEQNEGLSGTAKALFAALSKDSLTLSEMKDLQSGKDNRLSGIKDEKLKDQLSDFIGMKIAYGTMLNDQMELMRESHLPVHYLEGNILQPEREFQVKISQIAQNSIGNKVAAIALSLRLSGEEDRADKLLLDFNAIGTDANAPQNVLKAMFPDHPEYVNQANATYMVEQLKMERELRTDVSANSAKLQVVNGLLGMVNDGYTITAVPGASGMEISDKIKITKNGKEISGENKDKVISEYGIENNAYSMITLTDMANGAKPESSFTAENLALKRTEAIQASSGIIEKALGIAHQKDLEAGAAAAQIVPMGKLADVLDRNGMALEGFNGRNGDIVIVDKVSKEKLTMDQAKARMNEDSWADFSKASSALGTDTFKNINTIFGTAVAGYSFSGADSEGNFLVRDKATGKAVSLEDATKSMGENDRSQLITELDKFRNVNVGAIKDSLRGTDLVFNGIDEGGTKINNSSGERITGNDVKAELNMKDASESFTKIYAAFNETSKNSIKEKVLPYFSSNDVIPYQDVRDAMSARVGGAESRVESRAGVVAQLFDSMEGMLTSKASTDNLKSHKELYEKLEKFQLDEGRENVFLVFSPDQKKFDLVDKNGTAIPDDRENKILKQFNLDKLSADESSIMKSALEQQGQFPKPAGGGGVSGAPSGALALSSLSFVVSDLYEDEKKNLIKVTEDDMKNRIYETRNRRNLTSASFFDFSGLLENIANSSPAADIMTGASDETFHRAFISKDYDKDCLRNYFAIGAKEEYSKELSDDGIKDKNGTKADYAALEDYHNFIGKVTTGALDTYDTYFGGRGRPAPMLYGELPPSGPGGRPTPPAEPPPAEKRPQEKETGVVFKEGGPEKPPSKQSEQQALGQAPETASQMQKSADEEARKAALRETKQKVIDDYNKRVAAREPKKPKG